jgi:copper chaperone CopZ
MNIKALAIIPAMIQQQQPQQPPPHDPSGFITALSSIAPALASTACCWGPAALSVFGAASGSSSAFFSSVSKFRPHFLALSATMISYSFYKVYGPPSRQEHACCKSEAEKAKHAKALRINRIVAWASLGIAVAGASYGRVALPKRPFMMPPFKSSPPMVGPAAAGGGAAGFGAATKNMLQSASSSPAGRVTLKVEGMHCGGCASKIKNAIENLGGVQNVVVDHKTGATVVEGIGGNTVNVQAIKSVIAKLGYNAG